MPAGFNHAFSVQPFSRLSIAYLATLLVTLLHPLNTALAADTPETPLDHTPQVIALGESAALSKRLLQTLERKGQDYKPRTEHLRSDGSPVYLNRLIEEDSPYLIQHAHNPVNWYPWGEEAFATAKAQDKPIFLSIGYATCHWCHVMERESFENEAIADILNTHFIAIKVDREQRPDVDATYMTAVQLINGSGGWPMSSFLDHEAKPFYGGTYYRPDHFSKLLTRLNELWDDERPMLLEESAMIAEAVANSNRLQGEATAVTTRQIDSTLVQLMANHDDLQGGFGTAPKFPQEANLYLLLEQARRHGNAQVLEVAHFSLQQMAAGGIHDQVGGGFHRYSVDNGWLVPHFEKMLYNQAALSRVYLAAFELTANTEHARTARRALDYILREMTSPEGGFYSATDADSEGHEGLFFIWTPAELEAVLGEADARLAASYWGVSESGNFEGSNILHLENSIEAVAEENNLSASELEKRLNAYSEKLLAARATRIPPLLDDKIITAWNGMMITAMTEAYQTLDEQRYLDAAISAAEFVWQHNRKPEGLLWRAHFEGNSSIEASQTDYAYLAESFLSLFDATGQSLWLDRASELTEIMIGSFWDVNEGGFFIGPEVVAGAALPARPKDIFDASTASGNAVALRVLTHLFHRTGEDRYRELAETLVSAFSGHLSQYPTSFGYLLAAAADLLDGESGALQYAARGKLRVLAKSPDNRSVNVNIKVAPGWHINADKPLQDYLIGTSLSLPDGSALDNTVYPEAKLAVLGFERSELALYDGDITLSASLPDKTDGDPLTRITLRLQACSDTICLPPESLNLNLSLAEH